MYFILFRLPVMVAVIHVPMYQHTTSVLLINHLYYKLADYQNKSKPRTARKRRRWQKASFAVLNAIVGLEHPLMMQQNFSV